MEFTFNDALDAIVDLVVVLAVSYLIPFLKSSMVPYIKSKLKDFDESRISKWIVTGCKAAEQLYKAGDIDKDERKAIALNYIQSKGVEITQAVVTELESAVHDLDSSSTGRCSEEDDSKECDDEMAE